MARTPSEIDVSLVDSASGGHVSMLRHVALTSAIQHFAGSGSRVADNTGTGNPVVEVALTFERYLRGDDALETQERRMVTDLLAELINHMGQEMPWLPTGPGESSKRHRWHSRNAGLRDEASRLLTALLDKQPTTGGRL